MKRVEIVAIVAAVAVFGCDKPAEPSTTTAPTTVAAAAPPVEPEPVTELTMGEFVASEVPQPVGVGDGKIENGLRFTDANGDNLVVLWSDADQGLWAKHVILKDGAVTKDLREVKQVRGECEFDYSAAFVPGVLTATDLDGDGFGEVLFAYKYACRSDMSPQDYKLLVLENGEKAILRGSEILVHGVVEPIGDGAFEPEGFDGQPKLLEHASTVWRRHLVTQY